jgi:hypothetical protein
VEIDRLRSGKASVLSITPFAGLRRRVMRDCLTHMANIFRARFDFESAASPVLYEPHKIAMRIAFVASHTLLRRDIRGWAALFRF